MEISLAVSFCLILSAILSTEWGISSAVLEIIGGAILALTISHISDLAWLSHLAKLGVLALMFVAGFELEIDKFKKIWRPSLAIGVPSFIAPLSAVYLVLKFLFGLDGQTLALMSVALSTTSLALVYHTLKERNILDTEDGQIIFGAASIVDILSMVSLAIVLGDIGWGTGAFILFFILAAFSLPHFGSWMFRRYPNSIVEPELRFLMVVLVGIGFMAENVGGIHPAIVAFTLGMVMAKFIDRNAEVKSKMLALVFSFFAPIFFLQAGTRMNLAGLTMHSFAMSVVVFMAAVTCKYAGTYLPVSYFSAGYKRFAGILFNYRLTFGIVAANAGLESGILNQELYSVIMLVVVASAIGPGFLLRQKTEAIQSAAREI